MSPKDGALGPTAEVTREGVAVMVGLQGRARVLAAAGVIDAGLRGVGMAATDEEIERIRSIRPRIVVLPASLAPPARDAVVQAAKACGAELVELPERLDLAVVGHAIERALASSAGRA